MHRAQWLSSHTAVLLKPRVKRYWCVLRLRSNSSDFGVIRGWTAATERQNKSAVWFCKLSLKCWKQRSFQDTLISGLTGCGCRSFPSNRTCVIPSSSRVIWAGSVTNIGGGEMYFTWNGVSSIKGTRTYLSQDCPFSSNHCKSCPG